MLDEVKDDKDLRKTFLKTLLQLHLKEMDMELKRKGITPDGQGKNFIFFMDGLQKGDKVGLSDAAKLLNQMTDADSTQEQEEETEEDEPEDEEEDVGAD